MKARAYVVHRLPGRVRFKIPARRANRPFLAELERRLRRLPAVTGVATNPVTGSVLVTHEGALADLTEAAFGSEIGELVEMALEAPPVARRLKAEALAIDRSLQEVTDGEVDLATLASLGLLAMAAILLLRGRQPAAAVSLGWYATELLRRSADAAAG